MKCLCPIWAQKFLKFSNTATSINFQTNRAGNFCTIIQRSVLIETHQLNSSKHPHQNQRGTFVYVLFMPDLLPKILEIFIEIEMENFVPRLKGQL